MKNKNLKILTVVFAFLYVSCGNNTQNTNSVQDVNSNEDYLLGKWTCTQSESPVVSVGTIFNFEKDTFDLGYIKFLYQIEEVSEIEIKVHLKKMIVSNDDKGTNQTDEVQSLISEMENTTLTPFKILSDSSFTWEGITFERGEISIKNVQSSWPESIQQSVLSTCIEGSRQSLGEDMAIEYCNCMLQKMMVSYPDVMSALNQTDSEIAKNEEACLEEIGAK